ncbi:MAG: hypothetical protein BWY77_01760 [bacterium ADurb.Bin431]|nr:MAG: hypothetical protein BWY77_01760 [bacterium ADurb.Bin431]
MGVAVDKSGDDRSATGVEHYRIIADLLLDQLPRADSLDHPLPRIDRRRRMNDELAHFPPARRSRAAADRLGNIDNQQGGHPHTSFLTSLDHHQRDIILPRR